MNFRSLLIIFISLCAFVGGQIVLKHVMAPAEAPLAKRRSVYLFALGISMMTISFFLTLGLLQRFDLSYLYPFQGLSTIMISLMAAATLKEKLTLRLTLGALLISAGVILVSLS
ncbi:MAG: EamA family transporter [Verrucomicrobiota bacterium]